jgi:four helix bundle protein
MFEMKKGKGRMEKEGSETGKRIRNFEDLDIWKESMRVTVELYGLLKNLKDYGLKDQIQRSAVSIPSNIAEGFERQTNKEFIQYLFIAKGSAGELRTQIYLLIKLKIIDELKAQELIDQVRKISSMIYKLIQVRKSDF